MKRKRAMKGKGWFESISRKMHKERDAECKRWQHEKKRKTRKLKGGSKTRKGTLKGIRKGTRKGTRKGARKGTRKQTGGSNSWKDSRLRRDLKATLSFI